MLGDTNELRIAGRVSAPPEIVPAKDGEPELWRCRVSVPVDGLSWDDNPANDKGKAEPLSLTVVAYDVWGTYELRRCTVDDDVFIEGSLCRDPGTGRMALMAELVHRYAPAALEEAANG